jgi:hypothetical protein
MQHTRAQVPVSTARIKSQCPIRLKWLRDLGELMYRIGHAAVFQLHVIKVDHRPIQ